MFIGRNEEERALAGEEGSKYRVRGSEISKLDQYPDTAERLFAGDMGFSLRKGLRKVGRVAKKAGRVVSAPLLAPMSLVARVPGLKKIPGVGKVIASMQKMSDANLSYVASKVTKAATLPIRMALRKPRAATINAIAKKNGHAKPTKEDVREANTVIVNSLKNFRSNDPKLKAAVPLLRFAGHIVAKTGTSVSGEEVVRARKQIAEVGIFETFAGVSASAAIIIALGGFLAGTFIKNALSKKKSAAAAPDGTEDPSQYESAPEEYPTDSAPEEYATEEAPPEEYSDESGAFSKLSVLGLCK